MAKAKRFKKSYNQLAKHYGCSVSSLKYWAKQGIDLDQDVLVAPLVEQWKRTNAKKLSPSQSPRTPVLIEGSDRLDAQGSLERAQRVELATYQRYIDAEKTGHPLSDAYRKEWIDAAEHKRKLENDTPAVNLANKKTITVDDVESVLNHYFVKLRISLESLPERVTKELPQEVGAVVLNSIRIEINKYIAALFRCPLLEKEIDE